MSGSSGFKWADGKDVKGNVPLEEFPLNYTLLNHAGISGLIFVWIWFGSYRSIWNPYNWGTVVVVSALFLFLALISPQFANNVTEKKLTLRKAPSDYDWLRYARSRMKLLILVFSLNTSLLIWATGGLSSPFIPFYIMVFILALSYCKFPQPASSLTFAFVGILLTFLILAEIPYVHRFIPAPVDDSLQLSINSGIAKKFFDGGFVLASMLVPLVSMYLAANRTASEIAPPPTLDGKATTDPSSDSPHVS